MQLPHYHQQGVHSWGNPGFVNMKFILVTRHYDTSLPSDSLLQFDSSSLVVCCFCISTLCPKIIKLFLLTSNLSFFRFNSHLSINMVCLFYTCIQHVIHSMCSGNCDEAEGNRLLQFRELRGKVAFLNMSQSCITNAVMAITLSTEKKLQPSLIQKLSIREEANTKS